MPDPLTIEEITKIGISGAGFGIVRALLGIIFISVLLKILDGITARTPYGREFQHILKSNTQAFGLYYGLRFMGACILMGQVLT